MARTVRAEALVEAVEKSVRPRMKGKDAVALEVIEKRIGTFYCSNSYFN